MRLSSRMMNEVGRSCSRACGCQGSPYKSCSVELPRRGFLARLHDDKVKSVFFSGECTGFQFSGGYVCQGCAPRTWPIPPYPHTPLAARPQSIPPYIPSYSRYVTVTPDR